MEITLDYIQLGSITGAFTVGEADNVSVSVTPCERDAALEMEGGIKLNNAGDLESWGKKPDPPWSLREEHSPMATLILVHCDPVRTFDLESCNLPNLWCLKQVCESLFEV